jgi:predicted MPP superfamily phosphohydrolase
MLEWLLDPRQWIPAVALAGCGVLIFLFLVNQRLLVVRDSRKKLPTLFLVLFLLTGGGFLLSLALPFALKVALPSGVGILILLGEGERIRIRRACKGSPPVDTVFHDVPLLRPVTTTDLVIHRYAVTLPAWKGPAFRIVHLSDFHVHPSFDEAYYRTTLERAAALAPDYAFFTGDYVTRTASIPILERVIRPISKRGDFAVLGNHDHWTDPEQIQGLLARKGIRMLVNTCADIEVGGQTIQLIGCDYGGFADIRIPEITGRPVLKLALCHTPDAIYELAKAGAHAVFSGHNHAGQARIPGLGPVIVPSRFGRLFDHGHFVVEGAHLFVSSGVGAATPPLRFYCQPDIFVVDVSGASAPVISPAE